MWKNTETNYGIIAISLHWLVALVVFEQLALGLWMVELTYYDPWYRTAPSLHKSIGVLLFIVLVVRLGWRYHNPHPSAVPGVGEFAQRLAVSAHRLLYALLFLVMLSGYFISTADGRAIEVFKLFSVPALWSGIPNQEDIAGEVHFVLAMLLVTLVAIHIIAALKHHYIDRDATLKRMFRTNV